MPCLASTSVVGIMLKYSIIDWASRYLIYIFSSSPNTQFGGQSPVGLLKEAFHMECLINFGDEHWMEGNDLQT
jgi:hypothetical protein